ncbi:MAG: hypothetical protein QXJ28_02080 [Candidatus Pacearchaeota archaeon]
MRRGVKLSFLIIFIALSIITIPYLNKNKTLQIKEIINSNLLSFNSNKILLGIIILFIVIISYILIKKRKSKKIEDEIKVSVEKKEEGLTDIDLLYELLKRKKRMNISTIAKIFKINKELAIEWARILEEGDLAEINYPILSEPTLEIKEKEEDREDYEIKKIKEKIDDVKILRKEEVKSNNDSKVKNEEG